MTAASDSSGGPAGPADEPVRWERALVTGASSGIGRAFARLWCALPAFRVFGWLGLLPPVAWALDRGYDYFLPLRPRLQAWFKNR